MSDKKKEQEALIGLVLIIITGGLFIAYYLLKWIWDSVTRPNRRKKAEEQRRYNLIEKYNNAVVVAKIMNQTIWVDQTSEQLIDSIGRPEDVNEKFLKTKKKEVWKYCHQGANRYGLRITLDNGKVVG